MPERARTLAPETTIYNNIGSYTDKSEVLNLPFNKIVYGRELEMNTIRDTTLSNTSPSETYNEAHSEKDYYQTLEVVKGFTNVDQKQSNLDIIVNYIENMRDCKTALISLLTKITKHWQSNIRHLEVEDLTLVAYIRSNDVGSLLKEINTFVNNNWEEFATCGVRFLFTTDFLDV